jgi:hypothetical protein
MRTVRRDANELNRQVFGLLILGQFLPSGYTIQADDLTLNTVGEMLSNQFSIYLTQIITEFFTGTNLIEGIDFDIQYDRFTAASAFDPNQGVASTELTTRLKVNLKNRISIQAGGQFGNSVYSNTSGLLGADFEIEYAISKDGRLKVKAYGNQESDIAGGRRRRGGIGLTYNREFDSFKELFEEGRMRRERNKLRSK